MSRFYTVFALMALGFCLGFIFGGCGEPVDAAAPAKCEAFKGTLCARIVECGASTQRECLDQLSVSIDCATVADVAPSYDACLSELRTFSCSVLDRGRNTPAACNGVLLR